MSLAASYYDTNSARAAFYPQITLSGSAGWTNSAGSAIINPGKLLASAIGSLTQTSVLPRCQHCPVETSKGTGRASQNPVPDHTAQGRK